LVDFRLDGEHSEASNPRLGDLLEVVDETEELVQTGRADLAGC
jgi:hypothetical protein